LSICWQTGDGGFNVSGNETEEDETRASRGRATKGIGVRCGPFGLWPAREGYVTGAVGIAVCIVKNRLPLPANGSSFAVCREEACRGTRITRRSAVACSISVLKRIAGELSPSLSPSMCAGRACSRKVLTLADIERSVTPSSSGALVLRLQFVMKALRTGKIGVDQSLRWWAISAPQRWQACLADLPQARRT
jgi:hypothetical protein